MVSVGLLRSSASWTIRSMLASMVSDETRVVRTARTPSMLMVPAYTSSFTRFDTGTDSPVMAAWSTVVTPSTTLPSRGTRSPGRTMNTSPGTTFPTGRSTSSSPRLMVAISGLRSISASMACRALSDAMTSSLREMLNRKTTSAPSWYRPMTVAPIAAMVTRRLMPTLPLRRPLTPLSASGYPVTAIAATRRLWDASG